MFIKHQRYFILKKKYLMVS